MATIEKDFLNFYPLYIYIYIYIFFFKYTIYEKTILTKKYMVILNIICFTTGCLYVKAKVKQLFAILIFFLKLTRLAVLGCFPWQRRNV